MKKVFLVVKEHPNDAGSLKAAFEVKKRLAGFGVDSEILPVPREENAWHKSFELLKHGKSDASIDFGSHINDWLKSHGRGNRNALYFVFHNTPLYEYCRFTKRNFIFIHYFSSYPRKYFTVELPALFKPISNPRLTSLAERSQNPDADFFLKQVCDWRATKEKGLASERTLDRIAKGIAKFAAGNASSMKLFSRKDYFR
ncbi:hypothetical protein HY991_05130 [Candidatus Micrarchaeota archaeon]|nr:hypothetical protein [Candidatus Micrarchaeota archaeon]